MKGVKHVVLRLLAALGAYCLISLVGLSSVSLADSYIASSVSRYCYGNNNGATCSYGSPVNSPAQACQSGQNYMSGNWGACTTGHYCALGGAYQQCVSRLNDTYECPYGGTLSGTTCLNAPSCPTGETRDSNGQCQPLPECSAVESNTFVPCGIDINGDRTLQSSEYQYLPTVNHGPCKANVNNPVSNAPGGKPYVVVGSDKKFYCYAKVVTAGTSLPDTPSTESNPLQAQNNTDCTSYITLNGKTQCLKSNSAPPTQKTAETTNQRTTNPDGSITEVQTTKHDNGSQTTITNTWNSSNVSNGQPVGSPDSSKKETITNADGESTPDEVDMGDIQKTDAWKITQNLTWTPGTVTTNQQCPSDKTFSVMGKTYTVSYSPICSAASDYIRPFVLVMASMLALSIFTNGVKK